MIGIAGDFDALTVSEVERTVDRVVTDGARRLVIDLTDTEFLDSSALAALVHWCRKARTLGSAFIVVATRTHQPVTKFDLSGTRQFFLLCETLDEALALDVDGHTATEGAPSRQNPDRDADGNGNVRLRLYVLGRSGPALRALRAVDELRDAHLPDGSEVEVLDLREHPEVAERERILATPLLVRLSPGPVRRIVGDLEDLPEVAFALDLPTARRSA